MMTKVLVKGMLLVLLLVAGNTYATGDNDKKDGKGEKGEKESKRTMAQPDVPGSLVIEIANNILTNKPEEMALYQLGSWTVNVYYLYGLKIGESNFSVNPGFGVGLEKYRWDDPVVLTTSENDRQTFVTPATDIVPGASRIRKTKHQNNYFDFPLEIRWHSDKDNHRKSFKVAVGGKVGILWSHSKIKYEENDQTKKLKDKQNFNIRNPRYGIYGRVGWSGVGLVYYYSLSEFFENKAGPQQTRARSMMVGISISGF